MSDAECREPAIFCILHPAFTIQGAYFSTCLLPGPTYECKNGVYNRADDVQHDDIDRLVEALNESAAPAPRVDAAASARLPAPRLEAWLRTLVARGGSDLFLVAGAPPCIRVDGTLHPLSEGPLDGQDVEEAVLPALSPFHIAQYRERRTADLSLRIDTRHRFRVNLHHERERAAVAIRALPTVVPSIAELHFPLPIDALARLGRGLVLICGATGSGKTTTMASIVADINARERRHIITIEDPIEYEHPHGRCLVEHQELGSDVTDFATALRAAVRQAPDVLVVGEMRDPETMRLAVNAAETGHLVLSTLHATDVSSAVSRVVESFPTERQAAVRQELAMALAAVLTQTLVPRADGSGRVPAAELLVVSYGARQHIRKNALQHLHQEITITRKLGSFTLEETLARLVQQGTIERAEAVGRAAHAEELEGIIGR
jgi:twitching motility protein PilT